MTVINAIILGLVQGIAEFLPISSSGHLAILNNLFGMTTTENGHMFFDVLLHLGTLISICIVYWQDIVDMFYEVLAFANLGPRAGERQERYPAARLFFMIVLATLPLFLILPINDMLEGLYYNNVFIGLALILTGAMLYVSDKMKPGRKNENSMTVWDALIIGLCQCVATIPGLSRSGTTITAGIATGLRREFAVKFSFLMSIPAILGSVVLQVKDLATGQAVALPVVPVILGTAVAALSSLFAIKFMLYIVKRTNLRWFALYTAILGVLVCLDQWVFHIFF